MTDRDRIGDQLHGRDEAGRPSRPAPGLNPQSGGSGFDSEPLAGEGADEEEAVITRGPGHGTGSGVAGEGTTEEADR